MTIANLHLLAVKTEEEPVLAAVSEEDWNVEGAGGILSRVTKALYLPLQAPALRQAPTSHVTMERALKTSVRSECEKWKSFLVCQFYSL